MSARPDRPALASSTTLGETRAAIFPRERKGEGGETRGPRRRSLGPAPKPTAAFGRGALRSRNHRLPTVMNSHYFIIADLAQLRIFTENTRPGQSTPGLDEVYAMELSQGRADYTDNDTDMAGRFQGSKPQGPASGTPAAHTGMSIDERLPMQREAQRRAVAELTRAIESFLVLHPAATWDFAAGPSTHNAVLEKLAPAIRSRLRESTPKDLVNHSVVELRERFLHTV